MDKIKMKGGVSNLLGVQQPKVIPNYMRETISSSFKRIQGGGRNLLGFQLPKVTPNYMRETISSTLKRKEANTVTSFPPLTQPKAKPWKPTSEVTRKIAQLPVVIRKTAQTTLEKPKHEAIALPTLTQKKPQLLKPVQEAIRKKAETTVEKPKLLGHQTLTQKKPQLLKPVQEAIRKKAETTVEKPKLLGHQTLTQKNIQPLKPTFGSIKKAAQTAVEKPKDVEGVKKDQSPRGATQRALPPCSVTRVTRPIPVKKDDESDSKRCAPKTTAARIIYKDPRDITEDFLPQVVKAVKEKKIFAIHGSCPEIRMGLLRRGWVEKRIPNLLKGEKIPEAVVGPHQKMAELLRHEVPYFIWTTVRDSVYYPTLREEQMTNHQPIWSFFTSKYGLCTNLKDTRWFSDVDADTFFPRCYMLEHEEEKETFIEDFRLTAARSILKLVATKSCPLRELGSAEKPKNLVPATVITTALQACVSYLQKVKHKDIDKEADVTMTQSSWSKFLHYYYKVIHDGATLEHTKRQAARCQEILQKLEAVNPQLNMEGTRSIWIVKPGASSRGRDITCMDHLKEILKDYESKKTIDENWVVQKYIERPLLIYNTKFDVRLWFMVTDWNPLTIWFYNECYFRFSSQPYSCENLDISIHLCNNSIQKYLKKAKTLHPLVPNDNWSKDKFQEYLKGIEHEDAWSEVMVPGMKAAIIHAMLSSQENTPYRKNSFELYGADFMFGEDFQTWLIEINTGPDLSPSTPTKARLVNGLLEDMLRVVIDRKQDPSCSVGAFELIFKETTFHEPPCPEIDLIVEGSAIKKPRRRTKPSR